MKQLSALWVDGQNTNNLCGYHLLFYIAFIHVCMYIYIYISFIIYNYNTLEQRIDVDHLAGSLGMLQPLQLVP